MKFFSRALFLFVLIQFFLPLNLLIRAGFFEEFMNAMKGKYVDPSKMPKENIPSVEILKKQYAESKVETAPLIKTDKDDVPLQGFIIHSIDDQKSKSGGFYVPISTKPGVPTVILIPSAQNQAANIVNNVHVEDSKSVIQQSHNESSQLASQVQDNQLKQSMRNELRVQLLLMIAQISKNVQEFAKKKKDEFLSFYKDHKTIVIGSFITFIYVTILLRIKYLELKLSNKQSWFQWKGDIALKDLIEADNNRLVSELLIGIRDRYKAEEREKFFLAIVEFFNDVERESKLLGEYFKFCSLLKKMKVGRLFFINEELFNNANERMGRLAFLKDRLLTFGQSMGPQE